MLCISIMFATTWPVHQMVSSIYVIIVCTCVLTFCCVCHDLANISDCKLYLRRHCSYTSFCCVCYDLANISDCMLDLGHHRSNMSFCCVCYDLANISDCKLYLRHHLFVHVVLLCLLRPGQYIRLYARSRSSLFEHVVLLCLLRPGQYIRL